MPASPRDMGVFWRNNYAVLDSPLIWRDDSVSRSVGFELVRTLETRRPKVILERGSGLSTILLAGYAAKFGAKVTSLEPDPFSREQTMSTLQKYGLQSFVEVKPCESPTTRAVNGTNWLNTQFPALIDFVLLNRLEEDEGRNWAMNALERHLIQDTQIWVTGEGHEDTIAHWERNRVFHQTFTELPGGLTVLTGSYIQTPMVKGAGIAVTVMVNHRAEALWTLFRSVEHWAPGLLQDAHVSVMANGVKDERFREANRFINVLHLNQGKPDPLGPAHSQLFTGVPVNLPYHLHLRTGFKLATTFRDWLTIAKSILDGNDDVGQVWLRHRGEPTARHHMVTGKDVVWDWDPGGGRYLVGDGSYALDPVLMRTSDLQKIWPAENHLVAARRFHARGHYTAQIDPGAFTLAPFDLPSSASFWTRES